MCLAVIYRGDIDKIIWVYLAQLSQSLEMSAPWNSKLPYDRNLPVQPISNQKAQPGKNAHKAWRTSWIFRTQMSAMFDIHKKKIIVTIE